MCPFLVSPYPTFPRPGTSLEDGLRPKRPCDSNTWSSSPTFGSSPDPPVRTRSRPRHRDPSSPPSKYPVISDIDPSPLVLPASAAPSRHLRTTGPLLLHPSVLRLKTVIQDPSPRTLSGPFRPPTQTQNSTPVETVTTPPAGSYHFSLSHLSSVSPDSGLPPFPNTLFSSSAVPASVMETFRVPLSV